MSEELKPCPFCGGEKIRDGHIRDGRRIYCADCSASVTAFQPEASKHAASLWNCRPAEIDGMPQSPWPASDWAIDRIAKLEDMLRNFTASRDISYVEALKLARAALSSTEGTEG